MNKMTAGQLKQHARLLRERYHDNSNKDAAAALVQAELVEAQAALIDAQTDTISQEEDCTFSDIYPILGRVTRRGGKVIAVEHFWGQEHSDALRSRDIDMSFEWAFDPRSGIDQGRLIRVYIGTRTEGPRVCWYKGMWTTLKSKGNYSKHNWSCGGNWSTIGSRIAVNLNDVAADLDAAITEVFTMILGKKERIQQAEARVKAAELRIRACAQRDYAAAYLRQASHPVYEGQDIICIGKAAMFEAHATKTEAQADLVCAVAGI